MSRGKLKMLKPRLDVVHTSRVKQVSSVNQRLVTGVHLQARRFKMWLRDPTCQVCGRLVAHPEGYELDHIIPLWAGGLDEDNNCQVLCVYYDELGDKRGCHIDKTADEAMERGWMRLYL